MWDEDDQNTRTALYNDFGSHSRDQMKINKDEITAAQRSTSWTAQHRSCKENIDDITAAQRSISWTAQHRHCEENIDEITSAQRSTSWTAQHRIL